jgi:hypothetical protein
MCGQCGATQRDAVPAVLRKRDVVTGHGAKRDLWMQLDDSVVQLCEFRDLEDRLC